MWPPTGVDIDVRKGQVLKLLKAIHGLKKAPRIWSGKWDSEVKRIGFKQLLSDECFKVRKLARGFDVDGHIF